MRRMFAYISIWRINLKYPFKKIGHHFSSHNNKKYIYNFSTCIKSLYGTCQRSQIWRIIFLFKKLCAILNATRPVWTLNTNDGHPTRHKIGICKNTLFIWGINHVSSFLWLWISYCMLRETNQQFICREASFKCDGGIFLPSTTAMPSSQPRDFWDWLHVIIWRRGQLRGSSQHMDWASVHQKLQGK